MFTSAAGAAECCPAGQFVSAAATCCAPGATLDSAGACCAGGAVDACGVCSGGGVGYDRTGRCCDGTLTEDLLCCPEPLDRCGVCGDGSSCNPELVLRLGGVSEATFATIMEAVLRLMCAHFGFDDPGACPLTVSAGSDVLPASRQRRLRAHHRGIAATTHGHGGAAAEALQAADVGLRVNRAWAEARGAVVVPSFAIAPPALWAHFELERGRGLLDSSTSGADVLELSVRLRRCPELRPGARLVHSSVSGLR